MSQFYNFQVLDLLSVNNETYQRPYLMEPALAGRARIHVQTIQASVESDFQYVRMSGNEEVGACVV